MSRLARPFGLAAVLAVILGVFAVTATEVRAVAVATLLSGSGGPAVGTPDPNVEVLNAANVWVPAATTTLNGAYAAPFAGSNYIDAPASAVAAPPNPVIFRALFTLPQGCVTPTLTVDLHADNYADVYLNGPLPPVVGSPVTPNHLGGQVHGAILANFQNPPSTFTAPPPATFNNPGSNTLYIVVGNFPGAPSPNDPRALDFRAVVDCAQIVPPIPPPTPVYECFQLTQGQDPNVAVQLDTDNFGKDIVGVRTSQIMCESANKYRLPAGTNLPPGVILPPPTAREVLQCFRLQKGQDPNDPAVLDTRNFGPDKVQIRTSSEMCEGARKFINGALRSDDSSQIWQCFNIQDGENPNAPVVLSTNNFGMHRAFVGKAVKMCESAKKITANGQVFNADHKGDVYQCFRLVETPNINVPATLITRNFGPDEVRIRKAVLMCEPAKKTILWDHNPNDPVTDATDENAGG